MNTKQLYTIFNTGMAQSATDTTKDIYSGLGAAFKYLQDNITGVPVYSAATQALLLYEDLRPQKIYTTVPVTAGALLNLFFDGTPAILKARLATSTDPLRYCNAIALSSGSAGSNVLVGIGTAYVPGTYEKASRWLGTTPGISSGGICNAATAAIVQKIGESDSSGFYYRFHSPVFVLPSEHPSA